MYSVASCGAETCGGVKETGAVGPVDMHALWNFLVAASASPFTNEHRMRMRSSTEGDVPWNAALKLAEAHGLLPIVYKRLIEMGDTVPEGIRRDASKRFEQHVQQTLWLTFLLLDIIDLFQRQGIQAVPYKGPALAQLLYGDVTARQYSDIDILVRATDVPRARLLLEEAGFKTDLRLSAREQQAYIAAGYEFTFHGVNHPNALELQWRILPHFHAIDFNTDDFFKGLQNVEIGGKSISTLGSEDLMLVLCAHAAKHAWSKLSWTRDVAQLGQSRNLDWDHVTRQAWHLGIQRLVGATFSLAKTIFRTPVPTAVQQLIDADCEINLIAEQTHCNLKARAEPELESLAYFRLMTQLRERPIDRLRFWWRLAATPSVSEWSLVRLPGSLFPLYRAIRIARLGARLIRRR